MVSCAPRRIALGSKLDIVGVCVGLGPEAVVVVVVRLRIESLYHMSQEPIIRHVPSPTGVIGSHSLCE